MIHTVQDETSSEIQSGGLEIFETVSWWQKVAIQVDLVQNPGGDNTMQAHSFLVVSFELSVTCLNVFAYADLIYVFVAGRSLSTH